ncbi:uncharacterized protein LOC143749881 [Siphateles boraxobius]|uniref:uncharacterized protein LOC143749881 n=1 Tax=Siphateles boraxobius TaxID=180520 RepID=UPI004063429D
MRRLRKRQRDRSQERRMCFSLICCGWMLLSSVFAFGNAAANNTTTLFVNHGQSAKISCNYRRTNDTEIMTVNLQTLNHTLCSYLHVNSWKKQDCKDPIRFIWIKETMEISFELLNLQNQDTGTYTCTVKRIAKPPEEDLGVERVQIIVRPVLSLSCEKWSNGSPVLMCSVGFYHDSLEQLWIRDGDVLNSSHKSFNGSSYLVLPPQTFNDTIYSCWVNHSSFNLPLVGNLSSSVCYERGGVTVKVVFIISSMLAVFLIIAFMFIAVMCKRYRRASSQSVLPVRMSVMPEPFLHDHLQSEILYSTLGDHHPVPCSPVEISSKCNSVTTCALMLLCLFSVIGGHSEFSGTSVQTVHRGKSVNISCKYKPSNDTECVTVELKTNNKLCSLMKSNHSWINQSCKEHIRFIPKTEEMSFEVSNLQINDTGTYKCVVIRIIPPPSELLSEEGTFVQVIAHPNVSVSHVKALDGFHTIVCLSEGFYPSALKQEWMRNGGFQNVSLTYNINKTNPDGSFTLHSYLNVSDCTNYSCWVNHSSLSQPMILHLSPADCYENTGRHIKTWMALVTCVLLILAILIITVVCERLRRARSQSVPPVRMSVTPTPVLHTHLQSEIFYSTLGDHHPVPCSPVGVRSSPQ